MRLKTINSSGSIRVTIPKHICDELKLTANDEEYIDIIIHQKITKRNELEEIENIVQMTPSTLVDLFKIKKQLD